MLIILAINGSPNPNGSTARLLQATRIETEGLKRALL